MNIFFILIGCLFCAGCSSYQFIRTDNSITNPNYKIKSVVYTAYGLKSYRKDQVIQYINHLKELGGNTASLLITCYTENETDPEIDCDSYDTPSKYEIKEAAKLIQDAGIELNIRLYIDMKDERWRCHWNPKNKKKVFQNLNEVLITYSKFAEELKTESMIIGAEYCHLTQKDYQHYWHQIILNIRKTFKGKLSYGANWYLPFSKKTEYENIKFWEKLDWIGIDYYLPLSRDKKITRKNLFNHHYKNLSKMHNFSKLIKKPLMITEVGFPLEVSGVYQPYRWDLEDKILPSLQLLSFTTFIEARKKLNLIKGVFIWRLMPKDYTVLRGQHKGYSILEHKTFNGIKRLWSLKPQK